MSWESKQGCCKVRMAACGGEQKGKKGFFGDTPIPGQGLAALDNPTKLSIFPTLQQPCEESRAFQSCLQLFRSGRTPPKKNDGSGVASACGLRPHALATPLPSRNGGWGGALEWK